MGVKYHINEWGEKMKSYLTSAMSYCGTYDLDEFKNNSEFIINYSVNNVYKK